MKKRIVPRIKTVSLEQTIITPVLPTFFAISKHIQRMEIQFITGLFSNKRNKIKEIYTHVSTKSLAKIKRPLDQFLEMQNTTNQYNKYQLDKENINTTGV